MPPMLAEPVSVSFSTFVPSVNEMELSHEVRSLRACLDDLVADIVDDVGVFAGTTHHRVGANPAVQSIVPGKTFEPNSRPSCR